MNLKEIFRIVDKNINFKIIIHFFFFLITSKILEKTIFSNSFDKFSVLNNYD